MTADLKTTMLKLASAKKTWRLKLVYLLKAMVFYPFLVMEERKGKSRRGTSSSSVTEGDDVYPLF